MSAANKEVPTLAPLNIPSRPSDSQEITTTQTLTSHTENSQFPTNDPISDQPHTEELADPDGTIGDVEGTEDEEGVPGERNEGDEGVEEGGRRDGEVSEGIEGGFIGNDGEGREIGEGVDLGNDFVENVDDENPTEGHDEGETPDVKEGETPVETEKRHPDEGKSPVTAEVEEPESGGLKDIVDLVDEPESEGTPVKERITKRMTRRSIMLDEVDEPTRSGKLQFDAQGAGVKAGEVVPEFEEDIIEAEARRLAAERKRKGKQEVQVLPKKPRKTPAPS